MCAVLTAAFAQADVQFESAGIAAAESGEHINGMHQHGMLFRFRLTGQSAKFWMPSSLDLTVGSMESGGEAGSYLSFGPSYRFHFKNFQEARWFVDAGFHPTWLSRSVFHARGLGGNFHFTSHLGLGTYLGRQRKSSVMFRIQHTSNTGLHRYNPGLDMHGITFSYHFGRDRQLFSSTDSSPK